MVGVFRQAVRQWKEDNAALLGAGLSYYTLFSIAPLLIIAIEIAALGFGQKAAEGRVVETLQDYVGPESARFIQSLITSARERTTHFRVTVIAVALLLVAGLSVFVQLRTALHRIWRLPPRTQQPWLGWLRDRLIAFIMVLIAGMFVLALLSASTVLEFMTEWFRDVLPAEPWVWRGVGYGISVFLTTLLFVMTFRILSDGQIAYRYLWGGAFVSAVLFAVGKLLFGYYVARTGMATWYGAAGALVVFLVWVYYSAQILFLGAELVQAQRQRSTPS